MKISLDINLLKKGRIIKLGKDENNIDYYLKKYINNIKMNIEVFDNFLNKEDFSDLNKISYDFVGNKEIKIYHNVNK